MNYKPGILIIKKPSGWTSHDVVAKLRGILKTKRIGHGGTLDPMATGVLPVFIGRATRAVEFFENADKEYIAKIQFGMTTDTQDITGTTLSTDNREITTEELKSVIPDFLYAQKQTPPMYSAVKIGGKKLYELARKGIEIDRPAREVYISAIELMEQENHPPAHATEPPPCVHTLRIVCSKGTYIRTLCHDIGKSLGCGAVMADLCRTGAGAFTLDMAQTIDEVKAAALNGNLDKLTKPIDTLFESYPKLKLNETNTKKCKNGMTQEVTQGDGSLVSDGKYRVYGNTGEFLALSKVKNNELKTIKSFFETS